MYSQNRHRQRQDFYQQGEQLLDEVQNCQLPKNIVEVTEFCREMRLNAEVVGRWIWVTFDQRPAPEIIKAMKDFGFHWSQRRQKWAHNCGHESRPGNGNPWDKYDHYPINPETPEERKRNFYRSSDGRHAQ